jgi:hypothetical protein
MQNIENGKVSFEAGAALDGLPAGEAVRRQGCAQHRHGYG